MDPRVPEFHQAVCHFLIRRIETLGKAVDLLAGPSDELTVSKVNEAIDHIESDYPSPLRATLFDLGRILSGALPTEDIVAPPPRLKIHVPEE
jgi:hypothetical protein